ncbi:MAG: anhydro-N-acetylmuramic acid kinase [Gemmatimonadota bacterium]|nr:anhydro-N-acetylmuramic acid kinase [Gemmatimonadota bacterium]
MTPRQPEAGGLYVGLMSGTSLDGIDAALVRFEGPAEIPAVARLEWFDTLRYEPEFAARLRDAVEGDAGSDALCRLNFDLGERFAEAAAAAIEAASEPVIAIGSHGQTFRHCPPGPGGGGSTLQLGEPALIAERTGTDVIADFRVRDMAAGGHGAPLTPAFDDLLLRTDHARAVQNIGGMANVTALPPLADSSTSPVAFDTGPGVAMIDAAAARFTGAAWDEDGRLAASGAAREALVAEWMTDPFFAEGPPRSTGRERFGAARVNAWLDRHDDLSPADALATLTEFTARSIADSYSRVGFRVDEVLLSGGGARNAEIRRRLVGHLPDSDVRLLEEVGWNGDAREAAAFALLARQHVLGIPVNLSWATGAAGPRRLGKRIPA